MTFSHEDWLLLILSDGRWHSLAEILRRQPMMAHSRAAGLREKGYTIEHKTTGRGAPGSWYRLSGLGSPGSRTAETADAVAAPGDPSSAPLNGEEPWQQPSPGGPGRSESPAVLPDTRPLVSSSPLSGDPGAPLVAGANQDAAESAVGVSHPPSQKPTLVGASWPAARDARARDPIVDSGLSGASAHGQAGHGHPRSGCEPAPPAGSPPGQLPLPGVAA